MGNYDLGLFFQRINRVIPLREKMGNYDVPKGCCVSLAVIPLREKMGNNDNVSAPNIP